MGVARRPWFRALVVCGLAAIVLPQNSGFLIPSASAATPAPVVSADQATVVEGDGPDVTLRYTVSLDRVLTSPVTVDVATEDIGFFSSATAGEDYDAVPTTTLTFAPGTTSQTVDVTVHGDTVDEFESEYLYLHLSNASGADVGSTDQTEAFAYGIIYDDDATLPLDPVVSADQATVVEGDGPDVTLRYTVSLDRVLTSPVTVDVATEDIGFFSSATAGEDYDAVPTTTLTFAPGTTSQTVDVTVHGDTVDEFESEYLYLHLSNASGADVGSTDQTEAFAYGIIYDDDATLPLDPVVSADQATVVEGDGPDVTLRYTVSLDRVLTSPVTVDVATEDIGFFSSATAGEDYDAVPTTTLTFAPGTTSQTVDVTVHGDTVDEFESEYLYLHLSNASGADVGSTDQTEAFAYGIIYDDDATLPLDPVVSADQATVVEGDGPDVTIRYTVSLDRVLTSPVTVDVATEDGSATIADGDYDAVPTTTLTFAPGTTSQTVDVTVHGDTIDEGTAEYLFLTLSNASGADVAYTGGTESSVAGYIYDDDGAGDPAPAPIVTADQATVVEGDGPDVTLRFVVTLDRISSTPASVDVEDTDFGSATVGEDYDAVPTTTLTFAPGTTSQTVDVTVHGDTIDEGDAEYLYLHLSNASGADVGSTGDAESYAYGVIYDDDITEVPAPVVSAGQATVVEGDGPDVTLRFVVTLDRVANTPVSVDAETQDASATVADGDYDAVPTTTLTFAPGTTSQTVDVTVHGDTVDEYDYEYLFLTLSNASGADVAYAGGTESSVAGYMYDDDITPVPAAVITADQPTVVEGDGPDVTIRFTVSLDRVLATAVTVDAETQDGSATIADGDYEAVPTTTLTFAPGTTSQTVDVTVHGDTDDESNSEYLYLHLSNVSGANVGFAGGTETFAYATIYDDDITPVPVPQIRVTGGTVVEGDGPDATLNFTVSLDRVLAGAASVDVETQDGSATVADGDYDAVPTTTLTFDPGDTSIEVSVTVHGDILDEGAAEYLQLLLSNPSGSVELGQSVAFGTIYDDDDPGPGGFRLSASSLSIGEGDGSVSVYVERTGGSLGAVTVDYTTADDTATAGNDYTAASGTLSWADGETGAKLVSVAILDDADVDPAETFTITLSAPTGAAILLSPEQTTVTIDDDDFAEPTISVADVAGSEGDVGTSSFIFAVSLSDATAQPVTVHWATSDDTATTADGDYVGASGDLTFNPGDPLSQNVSVDVVGDTSVESSETFNVDLSAPVNATIVDGTGVGTIVNDDIDPSPIVDAGSDIAGFAEGDSVTLAGSASDTEPLTILWTATPVTVDADASCEFVDATDPATSVTCDDDGQWTLTLTADDGTNAPVSDSLTLTLDNSNPTVDVTSPSQGDSFALGDIVDVSATLDDAGDNDSITCSIDWGDGPSEAGAVVADACTGSHTYAAVGPYAIAVTATDDDNTTGTDTVDITVVATNPNHRPYSVDDKASAHGTGQIGIAVLLNDTDIDGDDLYISAFDPRGGRVNCGQTTCTYHHTGTVLTTVVDRFRYTVNDGAGGTASATVTVTVRPNKAPEAVDDVADAHGTGARAIPVLFNDSDPERDQLLASVVAPGPVHGTAMCDNHGCSYRADAGFTGDDSFDYQIDDGHDKFARATVDITVVANRGPTAENDQAIAHGIGYLDIGVLQNDRDDEGDGLTATVLTQPAAGHGTVTCSDTCRYTPPAIPPDGANAYPFTATFTYEADDGHDGSDSAVVTVTVRANTNPRARTDHLTVPGAAPGFESVGTIAPLPNDEDPDGDELVIESWSPASHGDVVCMPPNQNQPWRCTYSPDAGSTLPDSFTYTVYDGHGGPGTTSGKATATVTVSVSPNRPPAARDDQVSAHGLSKEPLYLLANDDDPDEDNLTVDSISPLPEGGNAVLGTIENMTVYVPPPGYSGPYPLVEKFTYTMSDGRGESDTATVTVTLDQNLGPSAADDRATARFGDAVKIFPVFNDSDPEGDTLTLRMVPELKPEHGVASCGDGLCVYRAPAGFFGTDDFTYEIEDESGLKARAVIHVRVIQNRAPKALPDAVSGSVRSNIQINPLGNDSDPDGDLFRLDGWTDPAHGTVDCPNECYYRANPGSAGTIDTFTYEVTDDRGGFATATVTVTIDNNEPPQAVDDTLSATDTRTAWVRVVTNDIDPDADELIVIAKTGATHGTVDCTTKPPGSLEVPFKHCSYTLHSGYTGPFPFTDSFTYTVSDGKAGTDIATVDVTVHTNRGPIAENDEVLAHDTNPQPVKLLLNDHDPDGDPLTIVHISSPNLACGTLGCLYTPPAPPVSGYPFEEDLTYTISDGHGHEAVGDVHAQIVQNSGPVAVEDTAGASSGRETVINVLGNDTDADGDLLTIDGSTSASHGGVACPAHSFSKAPACTYVSNTGYTGTDSFTYTISDGLAQSTTTVTITVGPANSDVQAVNDNVDIYSPIATDIGVLGNDIDDDGDTLRIISFTPAPGATTANGGTVSCESGAVAYRFRGLVSCRYTPPAAYAGPFPLVDTFTYTVTDGRGEPSTAIVTVSLQNRAPDAKDDIAIAHGHVAEPINVLENDFDFDGDAFSSLVPDATGTAGTVTCDVNESGEPLTGHCLYTPPVGFTGVDTFTYTVTDTRGASASASVEVTVSENNEPEPSDDVESLGGNLDPVFVNVRANDSDPDGDFLSVVPKGPEAGLAGQGSVTCVAEGCTFTPDPGATGKDSFTYTVDDGHDKTATATVCIGITEACVLIDVSSTPNPSAFGQSVAFSASLMAPGIDSPTGTITFLEGVTEIGAATLVNGSGTLQISTLSVGTHTIVAHYQGDGDFVDSTATSTELIQTVNPAGTTTAVVSDANPAATGAVLTFTATVAPAGGASGIPTGTVTFLDGATELGTGTLDAGIAMFASSALSPGNHPITARYDGDANFASSASSILDQAVGTPNAVDDVLTVAEDSPATPADVLANDTDPDVGDSLTITVISDSANGTTLIDDGGTPLDPIDDDVLYMPDADYFGPDSFTYTISDGTLSATANVSVTVTEVNDPPTAGDDAVQTGENVPVAIDIAENDVAGPANEADQQLTFEVTVDPTQGDVECDVDGSCVYTPETNTFGVDTFTYEACDDGSTNGVPTSLCDAATVTITIPAPTLTSIAVTPADPTIAAGSDQQFTASGTYSDGSTADLSGSVTWASASPAVATIDATGLAHAVGQGTSTISATQGAVSGSTVLTVSAATLTSIAVTPADPTIAAGSDQQFTASGTYSDGSTADLSGSVTWASASPAVATISATGLAHAVGQGTSTISATQGAVSGSTVLTVSAATLTSIAVTPADPTIAAGSDQQFTASGTYSDGSTADLSGSVTWASASPAVATIDATGLAHAVGQGTSTISATQGAVSGSTVLTVSAATLTSIAVTPADPTIAAGSDQQFTASGTYSDGSTADLSGSVTWASASPAVATISATGLAHAVGQGTSTISATQGAVSGSTVLTVSAATLTSIAVTPADPTIAAGSDQQFTASGTYSDGSTADLSGSVTWASASPAVATIDATGLAHAVGQGTSTISATQGAVSGSTVLTVSAATLTSIAVTPADPTIAAGSDQQFTASGTYSDGSTADLSGSVTWASASPAVATIDATGLAHAVGQGTSTISATQGAVSGSTVLTVSAATLTSIAVTPADPTIAAGSDQQFTASGTYSDGSTADLSGSVTWASASPAVATIDATGLAHAVGQGTSTISATQGAVSGSTVLTVSAATLTSIAVTPADPTIAAGSDQQFTASGTYSDGSTADLSGSVTWASASPAVATISATGLAHAVGQGTSTISATQGAVSGSTVLTVSAAGPVLTYTGSTTAVPGASINLSATLQTATGGPIAGRTVTFTLNGTTTSARTNRSGVASAKSTAPSTPGSYPVGVAFAGDSTFRAASTSGTLTLQGTTKLTYTGPTSAAAGTSITLSATLKSGKVAVAGRPISFTLNGLTLNVTTDSAGVASVVTTAPATAARYAIGVVFEGDATYAPSSDSATLRVR